jgi:hypothetical protein
MGFLTPMYELGEYLSWTRSGEIQLLLRRATGVFVQAGRDSDRQGRSARCPPGLRPGGLLVIRTGSA